MLRTPALKMILGLGLCSLGGAMLYMYFKNKDEEEETLKVNNAKEEQQKKKEIALQLVVSNEIVPAILGRSGANIKTIEEKTGTVIKFREKDDNNQYCEIRGFRENIEEAKVMLVKEINRSPIVKEEIFVPQSACGKILGRCGESLQEICRKSLAKVSVDSGDRSSNSTTRRVVITGNRNQVNTAKKLIEEKVNEDEAFRKSLEESEQKREPRRSPTNSVSSNNSSMISIPSQLPHGEKLSVTDGEKPLEVYVSAIASPAKFWLQLVGPQSRQLDQLVENMTEYYSNENNQDFHKIADPYLGQIVAALFKYDGKWYRAEIVGILPNEFNPRDVVLDLYFVDYGDSEYVAPHEVFELRTDFLELRFQAIECFLAHVKPAIPNESDLWDQQSIAKFEELTHVASWKKLISRVVTYKKRPKGGNHVRREGSPIPGVQLYDTSEGFDVNIAHALISQGYAFPENTNGSETNEVLRLEGGSPASTMNNSFNSSNDDDLNDKKNYNRITNTIGNGDLRMSTSNHHNNAYHLNGSTNDKIDNFKMNENERFLNSEKLNGNVVQDKSSNIVNQNWNRMVQS